MITITLTEGASTKPFEQAVEAAMDPHVKHFEKELIKVRTGRASTSMIEDIKVSVISYGTTMALKDLAALSAPEPQLLVIQPWDKSVLPDIEKALQTSDLGITPLNDGNLIRLALPKMSGSRRDEFIKVIGKKLEECKVNLRNIRKDYHNFIREAEKGRKISEDTSKRLQDILQKATDKFTALADKYHAKKEDEIKNL